MNIDYTNAELLPIRQQIIVNGVIRPEIKAEKDSSSLGIDPGTATVICPYDYPATIDEGDLVRIICEMKTMFYGKCFGIGKRLKTGIEYTIKDIRCELTDDVCMANYSFRDPITGEIVNKKTFREILYDLMLNWYRGEIILDLTDCTNTDSLGNVVLDKYPRRDILCQGKTIQESISQVLQEMGKFYTSYLDYGMYNDPNDPNAPSLMMQDPDFPLDPSKQIPNPAYPEYNSNTCYLKVINILTPAEVKNIYYGHMENGIQFAENVRQINVGDLSLDFDYTDSATSLTALGNQIIVETAVPITPAWDRSGTMSGTLETIEKQVLRWGEKYTNPQLSDDLRFKFYETTDTEFELNKMVYKNPTYRKEYEYVGRRYAIGKVDDQILQSFSGVGYGSGSGVILSGYKIIPAMSFSGVYSGGSGDFSGYDGESGAYYGSGTFTIPTYGQWQRSVNWESELIQTYYDEILQATQKQKPFVLYKTDSANSGSRDGYIWTTKNNGFNFKYYGGQNYLVFDSPFCYKKQRMLDTGDRGRTVFNTSGAEVISGAGSYYTYYFDPKISGTNLSGKVYDQFASGNNCYMYESTTGTMFNVVGVAPSFVYSTDEKISGTFPCLVLESHTPMLNWGGLWGKDKGNQWSCYAEIPCPSPMTSGAWNILNVSGTKITLDDDYHSNQVLTGMHFWGRHASGIVHVPWTSGGVSGASGTSGMSLSGVDRLYDETFNFSIGNYSGCNSGTYSGKTVLEYTPDLSKVYDQTQFRIFDIREFDEVPYEGAAFVGAYKSIVQSMMYVEANTNQKLKRNIVEKCDFYYEIYNNTYVKNDNVVNAMRRDPLPNESCVNTDNSILFKSGIVVDSLAPNSLYQYAEEKLLNRSIPAIQGNCTLPCFDLVYYTGCGISPNDRMEDHLIVGQVEHDYSVSSTTLTLINRLRD